MQWEKVMGLEVHLQLATQSKIFSSSATTFGAAANSQTNPLDVALPGTLPVLNHSAVTQAIVFGLGIGADIGRVSRFDRKNYFYPDSDYWPEVYARTSITYLIRLTATFPTSISAPKMWSRYGQEYAP